MDYQLPCNLNILGIIVAGHSLCMIERHRLHPREACRILDQVPCPMVVAEWGDGGEFLDLLSQINGIPALAGY